MGHAHPREEGPTDLRLLLPAAACWAGAALAPVTPPSLLPSLLALCVLGGTVLTGAALRSRRRSRSSPPVGVSGPGGGRAPVVCAVVLLCAATGGAVAALHTAAARAGPLPGAARDGLPAVVEVGIDGDPKPARAPSFGGPPPLLVAGTARRVSVAGSGTAGAATAVRTPVLLVVEDAHPDWSRLLPGSVVSLTARPVEPKGDRTDGPVAILRVRGGQPPEVVRGPPLAQRVAGRLRAGLVEAVADLPETPRGLLPALVIGDTTGLPPGLLDAVRAVDMSHLVVVSGAHLGVLLAVLLGSPGRAALAERGGLAARLGLSLRTTALLGGCLVVFFVVLCRPGPSVLRAAVCGGIAMVALATGRTRSLLPALAAAVLLLVLHDPSRARSFGFLLSVAATASLLTLTPRWSAALRRRGMRGGPADALASAAAAQAVCAPIVVVFAERVSPVAIPCNILAQLAFTPALVLGWAALALAPFLPGPAAHLAWWASWPTEWIAGVALRGSSLPGAVIDWPGGWWGALVLGVVTLALVPLLRRWRRRPVSACCLALILLAAILRPAGLDPLLRGLTGWPPGGWRIVACDVGQGDATVLAAGPATAVVVDAGPDPLAIDACLRGLGVRRVPLVVLTHFHADHVAGLPGVLRGRTVGAVQVSPVREVPEQAEFVDRVAREAGLPVMVSRPGERRSTGPDLTWEVLWPPEDPRGYGSNDSSVTLLLRTAGMTVLLPGDLEPPAQRALLAEHPDLPAVDVLKVPHHGSAHQHPPLLERLAPRTALISCGADNTYGHPAPALLADLAAAGTAVLRTDLHGDVALLPGAG
ncbi:MBL fold metallo-hydrolase, partial [Streptomyces calidiresistens]|nr:MBL fold metallo-hydrolase [Streptomyces calidiresistens]